MITITVCLYLVCFSKWAYEMDHNKRMITLTSDNIKRLSLYYIKGRSVYCMLIFQVEEQKNCQNYGNVVLMISFSTLLPACKLKSVLSICVSIRHMWHSMWQQSVAQKYVFNCKYTILLSKFYKSALVVTLWSFFVRWGKHFILYCLQVSKMFWFWTFLMIRKNRLFLHFKQDRF